MGMNLFLCICNVLIPVVMILGGWSMAKHCPKTINGLYGYRTQRSMANMDTWRFAHRYCGGLWWKLGWILLVPSALVQLLFLYSSETSLAVESVVICVVQLVVLLCSVARTEAALKKAFFADGTPK